MGSKTLGDSLPSVPQLEVGRGLVLKDGAPGGAGLAGMGGGLALGAGGGLGMPGEQQASQLVQNSLRTASGELGAPLTYPASSLAQLQQMLQVTGGLVILAIVLFSHKLQVVRCIACWGLVALCAWLAGRSRARTLKESWELVGPSCELAGPVAAHAPALSRRGAVLHGGQGTAVPGHC